MVYLQVSSKPDQIKRQRHLRRSMTGSTRVERQNGTGEQCVFCGVKRPPAA